MRRREITPIWRDVKYGRSGTKGAPFVMNDGESAPVYHKLLLKSPSRLPLRQTNGKYIYLSHG